MNTKVTLKDIAFSDDPEAFVAKLEGEERLAAEHVLRSFTIAELRKVSSF